MSSPDKDPSTRVLGKGMTIAAWVVALLLLSFFFNHWLDKQHNPNQQVDSMVSAEGQREVILQRNRMGHYVATGFINRHQVTFLLDTGATDVSIPARLAKRLGLERGAPVYYQTANGTITAYSTVLNEIRLGEISLHNVRAHINPQMNDDDILLGMSFLKQLEFTQKGAELILRQ